MDELGLRKDKKRVRKKRLLEYMRTCMVNFKKIVVDTCGLAEKHE
jgi:hypothetical protein